MAPKNTSFFEQDDESYLLIVHYFRIDHWHNYEDAYNYYDIDVNNILPYKKSDNEYVIRHIDKYRSAIAPLQLKIKSFYYEIQDYNNDDNIIYIENSDERFFEKMRKIWNKIVELLNINNAEHFVKYTLDDNSEYVEADVHKNTSFVKGSNSDELEIVLHSVIDNDLKTSLVQLKTVF